MMTQLKRMKWVGHVLRMREMITASKILIGKHEGKNQSEDPDIDRGIILKWIFRK
jgi:hypothetical protein